MFRRRLGALAAAVVVAAAIVALMAGGVAGASSRTGSTTPRVVRPLFRDVGDAAWLWTGARYALSWAPGPVSTPATQITLIDDQTGQVKSIGQAGCDPVRPSALEPLDLPWVLFTCVSPGVGVAPELYSPATGQWQAVQPSPGISEACDDRGGCPVLYFLAAAGRYWLQYNKDTCDSGGEHCALSNVFQNIQTGELSQDPTRGRTTVDLNAPDLRVTACRPLRVPTAFESYAPGPVPGSLSFYGSFALSIGGDQNSSEVYLERCGTHLHRLLTSAAAGQPPVVAANAHEVVWMARPGNLLSVLTLPRQQRFTIKLPNRLVARSCSAVASSTTDCVAQIGLTNHRLYVLTATVFEQLWVARDPLPPTRKHK
jgi:hypothetical protein